MGALIRSFILSCISFVIAYAFLLPFETFISPHPDAPLSAASIGKILGVVAFSLTLGASQGSNLTEQFIICFVTLSGIIHTMLEGFWLFNHSSLTTPASSLFEASRHVWIDFARSDARWVHSDPALFTVECMATFFCAPFAFLTLYGYLKNQNFRFVSQTALGVAQMYGVMVTWIPEVFTGYPNVRVDNFVLFEVYFWGTQAVWVIIPLILIIHAMYNVNKMSVTNHERKQR